MDIDYTDRQEQRREDAMQSRREVIARNKAKRILIVQNAIPVTSVADSLGLKEKTDEIKAHFLAQKIEERMNETQKRGVREAGPTRQNHRPGLQKYYSYKENWRLSRVNRDNNRYYDVLLSGRVVGYAMFVERQYVGIGGQRSTLAPFTFSCDPRSKTASSWVIAVSGLTPQTSSSSPSFNIHQTASLNFTSSCMQKCRFEEDVGGYRADILVEGPQDPILIDICGESMKDKFFDLIARTGSHKNIVVLNKYYLISDDHKLVNLILPMSKENDKNEHSIFMNIYTKQAEHSNREPLITENILEAFSLRQGGRTGNNLDTHCEIAQTELQRWFHEKVMGSDGTRKLYRAMDLKRKLNDKKNSEINQTAFKEFRTFLTKELSAKFDERGILVKDNDTPVLENKLFHYPPPPTSCTGNQWEESLELQDSSLCLDKGIVRIKNADIEAQTGKLYTLLEGEKCPVPTEAYMAESRYGLEKNMSGKRQSAGLAGLDEYSSGKPLLGTSLKRASMNSSATLDPQSGRLYYSPRKYDNLNGLWIGNMDRDVGCMTVGSFTINQQRMDPDHVAFLKKHSDKTTYDILSRSRIYDELRFLRRIALAIFNLRKSNKLIQVKHPTRHDVFAKAIIKGQICSKDRGVVHVSFMDERDRIYRHEKWQMSHVENLLVGHHRLLALIHSFSMASKHTKNYKNLFRAAKNLERKEEVDPIHLKKVNDSLDALNKLTAVRLVKAAELYGTILMEDSWGSSKFFKVYRYFSVNLANGSPMTLKSLRKLEGTMDNSIRGKISLALIRDYVSRRMKTGYVLDATPAFGLREEMIGWEIFLVGLCPSKTYGQKKHLRDALNELYDEIENYDNNEDKVREIWEAMDEILRGISQQTPSQIADLKQLYWEVIEKTFQLRNISGGFDNRFSMSPLCLILAYDKIRKCKFSPYDVQNSVPPLHKLCTARSSTSSFDGRPSIAAETLSQLSSFYGTTSTTEILYLILNKEGPIDLSQTMFDKSQVGGNREISVLSGEFRILQATAEGFFKQVALSSPSEYLNKPDKIAKMISHYGSAMEAEDRIMGTIDQTRWGPNSSTEVFSLMAILLGRRTTESYVAAIVCAISGFKLVEVPSHYYEKFKFVNNAYSIMGATARYHMGQGIFHNASSLYHAFCTETIQMLFERWAKHMIKRYDKDLSKHLNRITLNQDCMITSDDVALFDRPTLTKYTKLPHESEETKIRNNLGLENASKCLMRIMSIYYSYYDKMVLYFGYKTSTYKNVFSDTYIEFNSIGLTNEGMVQNDMKYIYSLIDPVTSGNILNDYGGALDKYYSAINSGCRPDSAMSIAHMSYIDFCRKWKINIEAVGIPSVNTIKYGSPILYKKDQWLGEQFKSESRLRFRKRDILKLSFSLLNGDLSTIFMQRMERNLLDSREQEGHRSVLTYSRGSNEIMYINCPLTLDQADGAIGYDFTVFIKNFNADYDCMRTFLNLERQDHFPKVLVPVDATLNRGERFTKILIRENPLVVRDSLSLLAGARGIVESVNYESSTEDFWFHLIRKKVIDVDDEIKDLLIGRSLPDAMIVLDEIVQEDNKKASPCTMWISNKSEGVDLLGSLVYYYKRVIVHNPLYISSSSQTQIYRKPCDIDPAKAYQRSQQVYIKRISLKRNKWKFVQADPFGNTNYLSTRTLEVKIDPISLGDIKNLITAKVLEEQARWGQEQGNLNKAYLIVKKKFTRKMVCKVRDEFDEGISEEVFQAMCADLNGEDEILGEEEMALALAGIETAADDMDVEDVKAGQLADVASELVQSTTRGTNLESIFIYCEIPPIYLLYYTSYMRNRSVANKIIYEMLDKGIISSTYKPSQGETWVIGDLTENWGDNFYIVDPNFSNKYMERVRKLSNGLIQDAGEHMTSFMRLFQRALKYEDLSLDANEHYWKDLIFSICKDFRISQFPEGREVSRAEVAVALNNIATERGCDKLIESYADSDFNIRTSQLEGEVIEVIDEPSYVIEAEQDDDSSTWEDSDDDSYIYDS